jgi:hypothetical protein
VYAKTRQRIWMVVDVANFANFQIKVPICGLPERVIQSSDADIGITANGWRRDAYETLDKLSLKERARRDGGVAARQRAAPDP